ncbi:MAG: NAD(P)H-dependent oxidoreductase [Eggerthellaceae bacterium]|nr:NAD(P)H-dependent oxidoreductase [Eggerthellaceae bacterium]
MNTDTEFSKNRPKRAIIHDLGSAFPQNKNKGFDVVIDANGKYAPCVGCFKCWTKYPATCFMADSLQKVSQRIGECDELIIVTENLYGTYSVNVKTVMDRSIGICTAMSTFRNHQMHHCLRYGERELLRVIAYGDITDAEKDTLACIAERNAINYGYKRVETAFLRDQQSAADAL